MDKFNKQLTVETHLREMLPRWRVDLIIDVGANEGQYAQMLRYIGYKGEIASVEPARAAFAVLQSRAQSQANWQAHHQAFGEHGGEAELYVSNASVFNSLHATTAFGKQKYGGSISSHETETIAIGRLDEFLARNYPNVGQRRVFLKMDTQGHDMQVFAGAGEYQSTFCGLQSEVAVVPIYEGIPDYMQSLAVFREAGYEVTGMYNVNRHRATGHVIEFDCVMAPLSNVVS